MKKQLLLIITLLFACASRAQVYTINSELKLNNVSQADASDSLLVWDNDGVVKYISRSSIENQIQDTGTYNNIPDKYGWYQCSANTVKTNMFNAENNSQFNVSQIGLINSEDLLVNRIEVLNGSLGIIYMDEVYWEDGSYIGQITSSYLNPGTGNSQILQFSEKMKNWILKYNDNIYFVEFSVPDENDAAYCSLKYNLSELEISNKTIVLPFEITSDSNLDYMSIMSSEVYLGSKKISNYEIGLLSSSGADLNKIAINDLSGSIANSLKSEDIHVYIEFISKSNRKQKIAKDYYNSLANIVNAESLDVSHSNSMSSTFLEVYSAFSGDIFVNGDTETSDFLNSNSRLESLSNYDIGFVYSADQSVASGLRNDTSLNKFYSAYPVGSNNLIRQNVTSSIDEFLPNAIIVTSRAETDNDGTDPLGTSYGFGTEFNEPTLQADLDNLGITTNWGSATEHTQSPATAIVAAKLKKIKDLSKAPWDIVRQSARETASNAGSYNIYRGFGVIDTTAAISLAKTKLIVRSQELGEYYESISPFPQELKFEDKGPNTQVVKKDLDEYDDFLRLSTSYTETAQTVNGSIIFNDNARFTFGNQFQLWSNGLQGRITLLNGDLSIRDGATEKWKFEKATGNFEVVGNVKSKGLIVEGDVNFNKSTGGNYLTLDSSDSSMTFVDSAGFNFGSDKDVNIKYNNAGGTLRFDMGPDVNSIEFRDGTTNRFVLNKNGTLEAEKYKLSSLNTAPSSATDTGTTGEIRITSDYIYVCIATDTWVRAELNTWP